MQGSGGGGRTCANSLYGGDGRGGGTHVHDHHSPHHLQGHFENKASSLCQRRWQWIRYVASIDLGLQHKNWSDRASCKENFAQL